MPMVNAASLREEFDDAKARIAALRKDGKVSEEVDAVIGVLFTLLGILIAVLLERTTRKTGKNSGLPPSQTEKDETARRAGKLSTCHTCIGDPIPVFSLRGRRAPGSPSSAVPGPARPFSLPGAAAACRDGIRRGVRGR